MSEESHDTGMGLKLLTFADVSRINRERCVRWFGGKDLDTWTPAEWACAVAGEAGEVCDAVKKLKRFDGGTASANNPQGREAAIAKIATEIGDTFIYLDLMAQALGIDTARAIAETFNRVSEREGFPERI
jgi:NTP pyrophosphatase (non-canonical NTP hydrolase)